jgi:hypothetical protein
MNDAPDNIWAGPSEDDKGVFWDVGHWDADFDKGCVKYLRYDKHRAYMADMRAAYYGSCEQIDEYKEKSETDKARIGELEAALTAMIHSFDNRLIDMDDARNLAYKALGDTT